MKNKFLVVCMILVSFATVNSASAKNNDPEHKGNNKVSNYEAVIGDFIDGFINTNYKKMDKVLSDNACLKIPRAEKVIVQNRASLINSMRDDAGTKLNCTSSYEVIAKSDAIVIARVDFQYPDFKQQNFVVMEKNEDQQWKITEICKLSQNTDKQRVAPQATVAVNP